MIRFALDPDGQTVSVSLTEYLGDRFGAYRDLCSYHGARYVPTAKCNRLSVESVVPLMSALREKGFVVDLDPLIAHICTRLALREGRTLTVTDAVRARLREYSWPGNVRELMNVLERALALSPDGVFNESVLPPHIAHSQRVAEIRVALGSSLQDVEDRLIAETLRMCGGDKTKAAQILGITPRTIYRWLEGRSEASTKSAQ